MKRALKTMLAAALCALGARAAERITLMVGGIDKIIYLPVKLAEQLGYFTDQGLDVHLRSEYSGSNGADQLLAGGAQGVVGFYDHVIYLQAGG